MKIDTLEVEIIFKPKYKVEKKLIVSLLIMIPSGWFGIFLFFTGEIPDMAFLICSSAFASVLFLIPFVIYRKITKITFAEYIKIERLFAYHKGILKSSPFYAILWHRLLFAPKGPLCFFAYFRVPSRLKK